MNNISTEKMENMYSQPIDSFKIKMTKMNLIAFFVGLQCWITNYELLMKYFPLPLELKRKMESARNDTERKQIKSKYLNTIFSLEHSIIMTIGTTYHVLNNDQNFAQEPTNQEYTLGMFDITFLIVDLYYISVINFDLSMIVHHLAIISGDLSVIVCYTYGNVFMWYIWLGELTAPLNSLRTILPLFDSDKIKIIKIINNQTFAVTFIFLRTFGLDWITYHQNYQNNFVLGKNISLILKITLTSLYTVSLIWVYQVVNMLVKGLCKEFPGKQFLVKIRNIMKKIRKYSILIYQFIGLFSFRYFLDFYGITDIPVKLFGKCNYNFMYAKVYY